MGQTDQLERQDVQAGGLQYRAWCSDGDTRSCKLWRFILSDNAGSGTVGRAARRALQGGGRVLLVCQSMVVSSVSRHLQAAKESGEKHQEQLAAELQSSKLDLAELTAGT